MATQQVEIPLQFSFLPNGKFHGRIQVISLPAMGPYVLGALRTSFSSGALSDQDKYKVLKQFDQPQGYRFPAVSEGGQLRRFQASWFVNYPWLAYSKSENGGYCACCMAFASSIRTGGKFGALVESPLTKFKKALETLAFSATST